MPTSTAAPGLAPVLERNIRLLGERRAREAKAATLEDRMAAAADTRADLDLQISLLAEHEITKLATLLDAVARKLDVAAAGDAELAEVKQDVAPEEVLDHLERAAPGKG